MTRSIEHSRRHGPFDHRHLAFPGSPCPPGGPRRRRAGGRGGAGARRHGGVESTPTEGDAVKGSQKPNKLGKKPAQKKLKERRVEKRAAARRSRSLDV